MSQTNKIQYSLNVTGGNLSVSGALSAAGNSNTVGSLFTTGGNVGIGTTAPAAKLDVVGNLKLSGYVNQSSLPCFTAVKDNGHQTSLTTAILYNNIFVNNGNCYNATTGRFTAPVSGFYLFSICGMTTGTSGRIHIRLLKNGNNTTGLRLYDESSTGSYSQVGGSVIVSLTANDYVTVELFEGTLFGTGSGHNIFSGYMIG